MAVAARSGPDARVPCPLCGGLVHPIAGKCKHCKADLASFHAPRAAAAAPLPALRPGATPITTATTAAPIGQVHWIGKPQAAGEPAPTASTPAHGSQPNPQAQAATVLPPRPTVRGAAVEPQASSWRSWPVVVIVLAMVAIIAAVVLMVLPASHDDRGKKSTATPAPERMPDVTPPPAPPPRTAPDKPAPDKPAPDTATPDQDPWADPLSTRPDPAPGSGSSADNAAPADATDSDDAFDLSVPSSPPSRPRTAQPGARHRLNLNANASIMMTMAAHFCRKMAQCGSSDLATLQICNTFAAQAPAPPANCPAFDRCVKQIDRMSCGDQSGDLSQIPTLFAQFVDCGAAAQC